MTVRIGQGFDLHPYDPDPGRALVLGGVRIEGERGLAGHSDADVCAHACADALLGAAGLGDLGSHFPDDDPAWRGADSIDLLGQTAALVRGAGFEPGNVDCTIVCDRPKLAPYRSRMEARLSEAVGAPVTVAAKRTEGVGSLGRGEAVVCWAVALVVGGEG